MTCFSMEIAQKYLCYLLRSDFRKLCTISPDIGANWKKNNNVAKIKLFLGVNNLLNMDIKCWMKPCGLWIHINFDKITLWQILLPITVQMHKNRVSLLNGIMKSKINLSLALCIFIRVLHNTEHTALTNINDFKPNVFSFSITISPYNQHLAATHLSFQSSLKEKGFLRNKWTTIQVTMIGPQQKAALH